MVIAPCNLKILWFWTLKPSDYTETLMWRADWIKLHIWHVDLSSLFLFQFFLFHLNYFIKNLIEFFLFLFHLHLHLLPHSLFQSPSSTIHLFPATQHHNINTTTQQSSIPNLFFSSFLVVPIHRRLINFQLLDRSSTTQQHHIINNNTTTQKYITSNTTT